MASTFSTNLAIELIGTGDQAGTWGTTTNSNLGTLIEQAISGYVTQAVATGTDTTITIPNGSTGVARNMYIELTGTGGASTNLIVPSNKKLYFIFNNSTGAVTVKVSGQTGVSVPTGKKMVLVSNGTDIVNGLNYIADFGTNSFSVTNLTASSGTITNLIATSGSITNLVSSDASATVLRAGSATLTHLSATSVSITNVSVASATISSNLTLSGGTANGVLYLNGSKVATSGSALFFDGTNLGVGTASPLNRLVVSNGSNENLEFFSGNVALNGGGFEYVNRGTATTRPDLNYYLGINGAHKFYISGSESMRLTSTGLGIGTASPGARLDVITGTARWRITNDGSGDVVEEALDSAGTAYRDLNSYALNHILYTSGSERMRLDTSGNLGIGTASPTAKLDVFKTSNDTVSRTNAVGAFGDYTSLGAGLLLQQTLSAPYGFALQAANAANSVQFPLLLNPSGGNVGIGTASPSDRLDVVGSSVSGTISANVRNSATSGVYTATALRLYSYDGTSVTNGGSIFQTASTFSYQQISANQFNVYGIKAGGLRLATANSGPIIFAPTTGADADFAVESMRLTPAGNLGIGTASPGERLDVRGGGLGVGNGTIKTVVSYTTEGLIGTTSNHALLLYANNAERARITSGGKMLVGTTTASGTLTVDGIDAISTGGASTYAITCGNDAADALAFGSDASFAYVQSFASRPLILNLQGNEVRVAGTTDQGAYNLQCNGTGVWGAGAYVNGSDARLKDNIQSLDSGLDVVKAIRPVTFQYKPEYSKDQSVQPGFIAQELQAAMAGKAYLEGVVQSGPEHLNVAYQNIIPILVKAIQELSAKVTALESK